MRRIVKMVVPILLIIFSLSGCSMIGFEAEDFLIPPRLSGTMGEIQEALEQHAGSDYILKYPRAGEYRSAIFMADFDSDGLEEAGAFYRQSSESSGIHFAIIDEINQQWKVVADVVGPGTDVEQVILTPFDESGQINILIGWNVYNREKLGTVYNYKNQIMLSALDEFSYTKLLTGDLDGDMHPELFSLLLNQSDATESGHRSVGTLMKRDPQNGRLYVFSEIALEENVSAYAAVQFGQVMNSKVPGLMIDSYRNATTLQTEIVYWNSSASKLQLIGRLYIDDAIPEGYPDRRESMILSTDINDDGILEMPVQLYCPIPEELLENEDADNGLLDEYAGASVQKSCFYAWTQLKSYYQAQTVAHSLHTDKYYFLLHPGSAVLWLKNLYYEYDSTKDVLKLYDQAQKEVLCIQAFPEADWQRVHKANSGYVELAQNNGLVYAATSFHKTYADTSELSYISSHFYFN